MALSVGFKLYLITDRNLASNPVLEVCERALAAANDYAAPGVMAVQLREKDLPAKAMFEMACQLKELCDRYRAPLLINDRLDVALASRADGVHLAANSIAPADARVLLGASRLIGVSTHSRADIEAAAQGSADFAVFGPIFEPISKGSYGPPLGRDGLAAAARDAKIPVFALGGIDPSRARMLANCGAAGVATIGAIIGARDPAATTRALLDAIAVWR